jgi:CelD/BcsL family acetyltransferase involved in cellulose biosynthesis
MLDVSRLTTLRVDHTDDLSSIRDDWTRLAEANGNVFASWEWNQTWWQHFGGDHRLALATVRDDEDTVVGIVPLYVFGERPLRLVRLLGHGHGDALGPIVDPEVVAPADALRAALDAEDFDLFIGDFVQADLGFAEAIGARVLLGTGYPVLRLNGSWADFVASRGPGFRKRIGKRLRKLEREHGATFRLATQATLDADLDALYALHRARFGNHGACFFCGPGSEAFHRDFAQVALDRGWLQLWLLDLDGTTVAAEYAFFFGGAFFDYQTGRDPAWDHASVGAHTESRALRAAFEEDASEFRFLRGDEPYKYRFATDDPRLEMIALARTARAKAALAGFNAIRRVPYLSEFARRLAR